MMNPHDDNPDLYDEPCCVQGQFSGVKVRHQPFVPPTADYGYQADLPDAAMNPIVLYKNDGCTHAGPKATRCSITTLHALSARSTPSRRT